MLIDQSVMIKLMSIFQCGNVSTNFSCYSNTSDYLQHVFENFKFPQEIMTGNIKQ